MAPSKQGQQRGGQAKKSSVSVTTSIWDRKADLLYFIFFIIHVPVMLCIDLVPLYPESFRPEAFLQLRAFYIETYGDKNFTEPTAWFMAYTWMEALYHLPLSIWAVGALCRDDPMVPVHLLAWGVQTVITTLTCLVEAWSWTDMTSDEKLAITYLYGPYIALAGVMVLDMFFRLKSRLGK
ncbi:hypothetical protein FQN54_003007 [Arachnomyces sp. PD_36]|nr:hypothetical protein FQN54_003007 [Arachnomyces sp. PD_36]